MVEGVCGLKCTSNLWHCFFFSSIASHRTKAKHERHEYASLLMGFYFWRSSNVNVWQISLGKQYLLFPAFEWQILRASNFIWRYKISLLQARATNLRSRWKFCCFFLFEILFLRFQFRDFDLFAFFTLSLEEQFESNSHWHSHVQLRNIYWHPLW